MTTGNTIQAPFVSLPEIGNRRIASTLLPTSLLLTKIRAGMAAAARSNAVETAPLLPPININTGTGNLNGTNGSGNNDIYKGPTDTIHPSLLGIQYHAQRDATAFRNLINSFG